MAPPLCRLVTGTGAGFFILPSYGICPLIMGPALFFVPVFGVDQVGGAVLPGGNAVDVFEGSGKVQLVVVADLGGNLADGQAGLLQQLGGPGHPVVQQVGLGAFAYGIPEHLAEVTAVQPADRRNLLDGDVTLVVLLDEGEGFLDVKIPDPALAAAAPPRRALDQLVQEQKPVGDQIGRASCRERV